jgi:hypothetical protein
MGLDREKIVKYLKTGKETILYPTDGVVHPVYDFVMNNLDCLSAHEQAIVKKNIHVLKKETFFDSPLVVNKEGFNHKSQFLTAKSIGSRSALIEKGSFKLKGCKFDLENDLCFPHEHLNFGETKMLRTEILFGVLSKKNVMNEILAFCFFMDMGSDVIHTPLSVFEYVSSNKIIGYCLVSHSKQEQRLESSESFYNLSIEDLIYLKLIEKVIKIQITENEPYYGLDKDWYAKEKSRLIIEMNFNGGFRGVLNSNSGNDIVFKEKLYVCDFDTFTVIRIPEQPNYEFIRNFTLWCVVELLKTSPIIIDYINTDKMSVEQATENIWSVYKSKSLLWKYYEEDFFKKTEAIGWNSKYVKQALDWVVKTDVFQEVILDNVINTTLLKVSYPVNLSFYTLQGY